MRTVQTAKWTMAVDSPAATAASRAFCNNSRTTTPGCRSLNPDTPVGVNPDQDVAGPNLSFGLPRPGALPAPSSLPAWSRRQLHRTGRQGSQHPARFVHVVVRGEPSEADADAGSGNFLIKPQCEQHLRRFSGSRGAGGASGNGDPIGHASDHFLGGKGGKPDVQAAGDALPTGAEEAQ